MGFFKKLWNVHDKVFHPIETSLKKKGGSNNISGLLKGAGITPKDAPKTIPGSSFQQRPGYNAQTHMFEQPAGAPLGQSITNPNNGGRNYTPNPFAVQQAQAQAIRQPMGGPAPVPGGQPMAPPMQPPMGGMGKPVMGAVGQANPFSMGPAPQAQKDQGSYAQVPQDPYETFRPMMYG